MSCYMCEDLHLAVLAEYAVQNRIASPEPDYKRDYTPAMVLGERLHEVNLESLRERYGEGEQAPRYEHDRRASWLARSLPALQIIKAAKCYAYQACEFEGWERSYARELVDAIVSTAIGKLPGYDAACWGIEAPKGAPEAVVV